MLCADGVPGMVRPIGAGTGNNLNSRLLHRFGGGKERINRTPPTSPSPTLVAMCPLRIKAAGLLVNPSAGVDTPFFEGFFWTATLRTEGLRRAPISRCMRSVV